MWDMLLDMSWKVLNAERIRVMVRMIFVMSMRMRAVV